MITGTCIILIAWLVDMPSTLSILLTIIGSWGVIKDILYACLKICSVAKDYDWSDDIEIDTKKK